MIYFKIWQFGILESRWEKSPYRRASCRLYINLLLFFQISSRWGAIWWNHFLRNFIASCDELSELSWWMVELTLNGKYQPSTTNIRATTKIWNSPVPGIWLIAEFPSWRHLTWRSLQLRLTMLGDYEDDSLSYELMNAYDVRLWRTLDNVPPRMTIDHMTVYVTRGWRAPAPVDRRHR